MSDDTPTPGAESWAAFYAKRVPPPGTAPGDQVMTAAERAGLFWTGVSLGVVMVGLAVGVMAFMSRVVFRG